MQDLDIKEAYCKIMQAAKANRSIVCIARGLGEKENNGMHFQGTSQMDAFRNRLLHEFHIDIDRNQAYCTIMRATAGLQ
jgi:hypothetical protein